VEPRITLLKLITRERLFLWALEVCSKGLRACVPSCAHGQADDVSWSGGRTKHAFQETDWKAIASFSANLPENWNFADTESKSAEVCQVHAQEEVHAGTHAVDRPEHSMVCMLECPPEQFKDVYWASTEDLLQQQQQGNPMQSMLQGRAISSMYC